MPDLTCLGKIIGGGLPVGAYGGKREFMSRIAPEGDVYQAGTLSGNPLALAAGLTTLRVLGEGNLYRELDEKGGALFTGLQQAAEAAGVEVTVNRIGSMGSMFFGAGPVTDFATVKNTDDKRFVRYYQSMLAQGVYLAPSAFEAAFVSAAHDEAAIARTIECAETAFRSL